MPKILINGLEFSLDGVKNLSVKNNRIFINGNDMTPEEKDISIVVKGDVGKIEADCCSDIIVEGNVENVHTQSGDVEIHGDVHNNVTTMSGDIDCGGKIQGDASTMSGDISSS